MKRSIHLALAVILQGAIFALFHGNVIQGCYSFIVGVVFSLVYLWVKSIIAPIILHMSFNGTTLILSRLLPDNTPDFLGYILYVVSLLVSLGSFYYLWRVREKDEIAEDELALNIYTQ